MASETEMPEFSSIFERVLRHRDLSLFIPFILGFTSTENATNQQDPDQETNPRTATAIPNERIVLINPSTQGMVVIEGAASLESLLRDIGSKNGQPPASKASIEAMASVEIGDDNKDGECAICLEEWELGRVVREMPCKHRFHGNCIEKWLHIHGSCPVCRHTMPVDEELGKKRDDGEEGRERGPIGREIWVSFAFNGSSRRNGDSNQNHSSDSDNLFSSTPTDDQEMES